MQHRHHAVRRAQVLGGGVLVMTLAGALLAMPAAASAVVAHSHHGGVPALGVPGRPTAPEVSLVGDRATVTWTPPDDGGSPITSWTLREYAGSARPVAIPVVGSRSVVVQGLRPGVTYTFTMTAINGVGPSPESRASNAVTPAYTPTSPSTLPPNLVPGTSASPSTTPTASPSASSSADATPTTGPTPTGTPSRGAASRPAPTSAVVAPVVTPSVTPAPHRLAASALPPAARARTSASATRTAPPGRVTPPPGELVPVHSIGDAASDVATVTSRTAAVLVLMALLVAFLLLQGFLDRRDPKLALAPVDVDRGLDFETLS